MDRGAECAEAVLAPWIERQSGGHGCVDVSTSRKYNLTLIAYGQNLFNHENLGVPNGTLISNFFGKSQSLAGGFFGPLTASNRSIFLQMRFSF